MTADQIHHMIIEAALGGKSQEYRDGMFEVWREAWRLELAAQGLTVEQAQKNAERIDAKWREEVRREREEADRLAGEGSDRGC